MNHNDAPNTNALSEATIQEDMILSVYTSHLRRTNRLIKQNDELIRTYNQMRSAHVKAIVELEELKAERLRVIKDIQREFPDLNVQELSSLN